MIINLTKLLERNMAFPINLEQTNASYYLKADHEETSSEDAYSFELEKETFILEK